MGEDQWVKQESGSFWNPTEKGEEVIGTVVKSEDGKYGTSYHIQKADGTVAITKGHKVLLNRMSDVQTHDEVKIVYQGEAPSSNGKPMKMYDVFIKKK